MLFHFTIFLMVLSRMQWAAYFHDGMWSLKFILILAVFIAFQFINNDFFQVYGDVSRVISFLFLVFQTIMILSVAYKINDSLVKVYNDGEVKSVGFLMIILTFMLYGGSITWIVFQYIEFSGCWTNILIISITVFFSLAFTICLFL